MALSEKDIDTLEELLFSDEVLEDTLDYFGLHGLICASTVGPKELSLKQVLTILFDQTPPSKLSDYEDHLVRCITTNRNTQQQAFILRDRIMGILDILDDEIK